MKVTQIKNNQFSIKTQDAVYFQSYDSMIARVDVDGSVRLSEHWDYSRTTMKYLGQFLGENAASIREKIKSGEFKVDLPISGSEV